MTILVLKSAFLQQCTTIKKKFMKEVLTVLIFLRDVCNEI